MDLQRQISASALVATEAFEFSICQDRLVDPVTTECSHTFCRHCISKCFGQVVSSFTAAASPTVPCPLCRASIAIHYDVNPGLVAQMRQQGLLRSQQPGAHVGTGATINDIDGNRTETETFDLVFERESTDGSGNAGAFEADFVWRGGTVHSTYLKATCRVQGSVGADGVLCARADYSNGPWAEWSGMLVQQPDHALFALSNGKYTWHGWNKITHGTLELNFRATETC